MANSVTAPARTRLTPTKKICNIIEVGKEHDGQREKSFSYKIAKRAMHHIMAGYLKREVIEALMEEYDLWKSVAEKYYTTALACVDERNNMYGDKIVQQNFQRIYGIIDQCHEKGDMKTELQAIDMLNKMVGAYTQKIDVNADKPIFEIKIGGD